MSNLSCLSWNKLGLAVLIAGSAQIAALSGASAMTLAVMPGAALQVFHADGKIVQVAQKKKHRHYKNWDEYHRYKGGHRYRHRRDGYTYFYGGYYYASPWWTVVVPLPVITLPGLSIQIGE